MPKGGSKPGERRGGRKRGTSNKVPPEIRAAAKKHSPAALKVLVKALKSKDEKLKLTAAGMILDRAWGKPAQPMTGEDGKGPAIVRIEHVIVRA